MHGKSNLCYGYFRLFFISKCERQKQFPKISYKIVSIKCDQPSIKGQPVLQCRYIFVWTVCKKERILYFQLRRNSAMDAIIIII